jgi:hypothetical protein
VTEAEPIERSGEQDLLRNDLVDCLFDGLIDADIMATAR